MKNLFYLFVSFSILLISCKKEDSSDVYTHQQTGDAEYAVGRYYSLSNCTLEKSGIMYWGVECITSYIDECPSSLECKPIIALSNSNDSEFGVELASIYGYNNVETFISDIEDGTIDIHDSPDGIELILNHLGFE
ncbi:MAG: hypothetical protein CL843_08820 [Crocinitomicaceae bacterium]|nr:hypothetical protein [Crocinitomicaceae bacterium]|tara:strand:- start:559 stop:963 length:405 start_codon:yes stop_codon:yes gene_type:complete